MVVVVVVACVISGPFWPEKRVDAWGGYGM